MMINLLYSKKQGFSRVDEAKLRDTEQTEPVLARGLNH